MGSRCVGNSGDRWLNQLQTLVFVDVSSELAAIAHLGGDKIAELVHFIVRDKRALFGIQALPLPHSSQK